MIFSKSDRVCLYVYTYIVLGFFFSAPLALTPGMFGIISLGLYIYLITATFIVAAPVLIFVDILNVHLLGAFQKAVYLTSLIWICFFLGGPTLVSNIVWAKIYIWGIEQSDSHAACRESESRPCLIKEAREPVESETVLAWGIVRLGDQTLNPINQLPDLSSSMQSMQLYKDNKYETVQGVEYANVSPSYLVLYYEIPPQ
jgi:hypothetical protein